MTTEIRNYKQDDWAQLGELYGAVSAEGNAVFWWIGEEENWVNVYCAFEDGKMVAKGQVSIINIVPPGRLAENKHSIYLNLKTLPDRANDTVLLDTIYSYLYERALRLKETLSCEYGTQLCVGNDHAEHLNNQYFTESKGFRHLISLYQMKRNLDEPISMLSLDSDFLCYDWMMETAQEESDYLEMDAEVWPDTPLGLNRLVEYKQKPLWKAIAVREQNTNVGSLMVWKDEDKGSIEDVFVRSPWRKRGVAKFMLTEALNYFKMHGLESAHLMVLTDNNHALQLYESVGFRAESEEIRFYIDLH